MEIPHLPFAPARPLQQRLPRWEISLSAAFLLLLGFALIAPSIVAPGDPLATSLRDALQSPSLAHPFGTDHLGRDVFTRTVHGARYSLLIGVASTIFGVALGVVLGLLAGTGGRVANELISRFFDVIGAFPDLLFALVLIAFTGPGTWNLIFAIGIASAPRYGRVVRAGTLAVRDAEFVQQAQLLVASRPLRILRHVLPNALGTVPILATLGIGGAILGAAGLSYLGFGPQQPLPEWGSMLSDARSDLRIAWWTGFFPGLLITLTVISTTLIGQYFQRRFENRSPQ